MFHNRSFIISIVTIEFNCPTTHQKNTIVCFGIAVTRQLTVEEIPRRQNVSSIRKKIGHFTCYETYWCNNHITVWKRIKSITKTFVLFLHTESYLDKCLESQNNWWHRNISRVTYFESLKKQDPSACCEICLTYRRNWVDLCLEMSCLFRILW